MDAMDRIMTWNPGIEKEDREENLPVWARVKLMNLRVALRNTALEVDLLKAEQERL